MIHRVIELPVDSFTVAGVPPGRKERYHLVVDCLPDGRHLGFPVLAARGMDPGRTLLVCGAVHGDEYEGTVAIQDVFEMLDPHRMRGTFVGIPVMNGPAFAAAQRTGWWDSLNLARVFPGSPTGSPTERIAHAFQTVLLPQGDLLLDLHSAGTAYAIYHLCGYHIREGEIGRIQRDAAIAFGADLIWGVGGLPGRTLSAAWEVGIPAIYAEMRGEGRCRREDRLRAVEGIRNVMAYLGILEGPYPRTPPRYVVEDPRPGSGHLQGDHRSPTSGIFLPHVGVWDAVDEGQTMGEIRHPDGTVLASLRSARAGRVLFLRTLPRVMSGDPLVFVLSMPKDTDSTG